MLQGCIGLAGCPWADPGFGDNESFSGVVGSGPHLIDDPALQTPMSDTSPESQGFHLTGRGFLTDRNQRKTVHGDYIEEFVLVFAGERVKGFWSRE